jgi:hypothetical protein
MDGERSDPFQSPRFDFRMIRLLWRFVKRERVARGSLLQSDFQDALQLVRNGK